ncbi:MAG: hypothetical protein J2P19_22700, partial [Pseudonocardia sp.]|nr:hypothetical protein [Pseudonocardia sp.]
MALSLVVVIVLGSACSGAAPPPGAAAGAGWVVAENDKPGTPGWQVGAAPAGGHIEGFANRVDATRGEAVTLSVSSTAPTFRVEAYRLGYYHGVGARLVWRSLETPGRAQPACPVTPDTHMVSCDNWAPSLTVPIGDGFVPGDYLFKLVGSAGQQSYV